MASVFDLVATLALNSSQYEQGLGEAKNKADSIGGAISGGLGKAASLAGGAIAAASSAVVAFGVSSVKTGMDFDSSMSQVAATMGKTTEEVKDLRDFAQQMGASTAFSATQAADALNYMALAGYDAETSMKMLPTVLDLAAAGGMDLAAASDMVTDSASALGMTLADGSVDIEKVTAMVNGMAKASSKSNTSVAQLGEAILTVGGTAKSMKGGTTELAAALGILADNGTKGAEGGTALRNVLNGLSSAKFQKTFGELGVSAYDASGNMRSLKDILADMNKVMEGMTQEEKTGIINKTFNSYDLKNVNALLATTGDRWDELSTAIDGAGSVSSVVGDKLSGMVEEMKFNFDRMGGDADAFSKEMLDYLHFEYDLDETKAKAAIDTFLESVNEGVTDAKALEEAVGAAGGAAQNMAKTQLDNLNGDIVYMKSALEGVQNAVSEKLTPDLRNFVQLGTDGLSQMADAIKSGDLNSAISIFSDILAQGLNKIVEGLPKVIDVGIKIIGALAQGIAQNLPTLGNAAMQILQMLGTYITQYAPVLIAQIPTMLTSLAQGIHEGLNVIVDVALDIITALAQGIIDALPELAKEAPIIIAELLAAIIENLPKIIEAGINILLALQSGMVAAIPTLVESIPAMFEKVGEAIMKVDWLALGLNLINAIYEGLKVSYTVIPTLLVAIGQTAFDNLKTIDWVQLGKDVITFIKNGLIALLTEIPNKLKEIGTNAENDFKNIDWVNVGKNVIIMIFKGLKLLYYDIPRGLVEIADYAVKEFTSVDWASLGKNIINGIIEGIDRLADSLVNKAKDVAKGAFDAIKDFFDINSPSKKMMWMGEMIDKGLSKGIEDSAGLVEAAMNDLSVTPEITSPYNVETSGANASTNNNVVLNIYGAVGQDVNELAEIIEQKINAATKRREGAFA